MGKFLRVKVKDYIVVHGYDDKNKEIKEYVKNDAWSEKLISIDRIQSIGEKYILTTYTQDRLIYWEYQDTFANISEDLKKINLLVY